MNSTMSNKNAALRWNQRAVGGQRSHAEPGSKKYFQDIADYRYGYETPFIPKFLLENLKRKKVLEIGVGNGIDAINIAQAGGIYSGIDITRKAYQFNARKLRN